MNSMVDENNYRKSMLEDYAIAQTADIPEDESNEIIKRYHDYIARTNVMDIDKNSVSKIETKENSKSE